MRIRCGWGSLLLVTGGVLAGCVTTAPQLDTSQSTPLQIRAIQTRTYDNHDTRIVLKTVINVLQDDGFLVDYGNTDLGLLHASKTMAEALQPGIPQPIPRPPGRGGFGGSVVTVLPVVNATTIEATANVSEFGNQIKVRINFQRKLGDSTGRVVSGAPVTDAKSYQEFFAKLERGLFIQKQGL